ncbi:hypothetical protein EON67_04875 [archaeon]|nr:MAG: hypothetical protein EON67_04875 [archaeon]
MAVMRFVRHAQRSVEVAARLTDAITHVAHAPLVVQTTNVYVSRNWWLRYSLLSVPGPICNADILCDHGCVKHSLLSSLHEIIVALSPRQYEALAQAYGTTSAPLRNLNACRDCIVRFLAASAAWRWVCAHCVTRARARAHTHASSPHDARVPLQAEATVLARRRQLERERIVAVDTTTLPEGADNAWYIMSEWWLTRWRAFIHNEGATDGTGRGTLPPGPIDNARLLSKSGQPLKYLRPIAHFRGVNSRVWTFLHSVYGGGPVLKRADLNIYSTPLE